MFRTTGKYLLGHKIRLLTTALAIMLGVAFMVGTFVLTDTIGRTFDDLFAQVDKGVDAVVRQRAAFGDERGGRARSDIPIEAVDQISRVDGVAAAEGNVQSSIQIIDHRGKPVSDPAKGLPTFGTNWLTTARVNPFALAEGRAPRRSNEVVIDRGTARKAGFKRGEQIRVLARGGTLRLEVVGILTFGGTDNLAGASVAAMDTNDAVNLFGTPGRVANILVVASPGVAPATLVPRVQAVLPPGLEAISGPSYTSERQSDVRKQLTIFNAVLQAFALVALVAGAFLIYNTFGIIVAQRTRELALLRALGASRRQVITSVIVEALAVGLVAAGLGLLAGLGLATGLKALFSAFGVSLPSTGTVLLPRTVIASVLVGTVVTTLSALIPAWRAARVPPIAAMREMAIDTSAGSRARAVIGALILAVGAAATVSGTVGSMRARMLIGAGLLFVAVVVLGPVLAPLVVRVLGSPLPRLRGITGHLGRENALRNPRRTANTAGALILAVLLVTVISIFTSSFRASINRAVDRYLTGDFQVDSGAFSGGGGLSPALAGRLKALPEVGWVTGVRAGSVRFSAAVRPVYGFDGAAMEHLARLGVIEGRLRDLGADAIAVKADVARRVGLRLGSPVDVTFPSGQTVTLRVATIFTEGGIIAQGNGGDWFLGLPTFAALLPGNSQFDLRVIVKAADGVPRETLRKAIERVTSADFPSAKVRDQQQIKAEQTRQINQNLSFILVMLALSVIIGVLGIAITLALSTFERTREIGLLRAVGMTRRQLRSSIRWEAVLISLLGTTIGLVLGVVIGSALMLTFRKQLPTTTLAVPVPLLIGFAALIALFGVLAAVVPGRRAARLDVLHAVTVE